MITRCLGLVQIFSSILTFGINHKLWHLNLAFKQYLLKLHLFFKKKQMSAAIYLNTKFQWKNLRHFSWTAYQQRFFRNIVMGPLQLSRIFLWERLSLSLDLMHLLLQKSISNCVAISIFWILFPSFHIFISAKYISFAMDYDFDRKTFLSLCL